MFIWRATLPNGKVVVGLNAGERQWLWYAWPGEELAPMDADILNHSPVPPDAVLQGREF